MLHLLPAEVALKAMEYLPIQSLHTISQVSHAWHDLIAMNESAVYRNAAIYHLFVTEEEIRLKSPSKILGDKDWKSFCRRALQIERAWRGKAPSHTREMYACGSSVHRIKVDEENGLLLTTSQTGGIVVTDIKDNYALWGLPPSFIVEYAHCEYDRGYFVVNRHDNCKEVWRRVVDMGDDQGSTLSPPDAQMLRAWSEVTVQWPASTRRGHFRAWALLRMPETTRAFRFLYPTLLVASENNAYIWDVPEGRLVETIRDIQRSRHDDRLGIINYVEVSDKYAFICGSIQLRIFERGGGALVFQFSPKNIGHKLWRVLHEDPGPSDSIVKPQNLLSSRMNAIAVIPTQFKAVHVSSDGQFLAALTICGVLVLIPGFQRVISGEAQLSDVAVQINLCPTYDNSRESGIYLAMSESNGKVTVATRQGIYLISPEMDMGRFTADFPSYPGFVVSRLTGKFEESYFLSFISCLQTTPTGIYFNWRPTRQNGQPNWANLDNHFPMFIGDLVGHAHVNVVHGHAEVHIPLQPNNNDQQPHNHHQHNNHAVGHDHGHDHDHIHEGGAWDINEGNEAADGMPGLEPSTFELADPFEDDEWEDEEEEEFDDFFDPDPDAFPVPGEGHLDPHDADHAAMHFILNDFFFPRNASTVYRVSF